MRIEAGALVVDAEGIPWFLVAPIFVLVHVLGPILWVFGRLAHHLRGRPRE